MSVFQRKDKRWQVTYRDYQGKKKSKTFPKGKAGKQKALKFESEIKYDKQHDRPLPQSLQEGIYLDDLLQEWVDTKKAQGKSLNWIKDWVHIFNTYLSEHLCKQPAHSLKQSDIIAVINAYWGDKSQTTRNRYIEYLKTVFEFGVQQGHLQENPLKRWKKGKEQPRKSKLTLRDLQKIQAYAQEQEESRHLAWAIEVAWNIPVRPGKDLYGLTFDNVLYDKSGVQVHHSKVNKDGFIQCSDQFMRQLWATQQKHNQFLIEYKGLPINSLSRSLKNAADKVGLKYSVTMYDIRHLWITIALDQGLELSAIAYLAGTSIEMIQRNYYEFHQAEKGRAVEIMPKLKEEKESNGKVINIDKER